MHILMHTNTFISQSSSQTFLLKATVDQKGVENLTQVYPVPIALSTTQSHSSDSENTKEEKIDFKSWRSRISFHRLSSAEAREDTPWYLNNMVT